MKSRKEEAKETFTRNRGNHFAFRSQYTDRQAKITTYIITIMFLTGLLCLFSIRNEIYTEEFNLRKLYIFQVVLSGVLLVACMIVKTFQKKNHAKFEAAHEMVGMFSVIGYLGWAYYGLLYSIETGRDINYLPLFVVYSICSFFFYFSVHHYFVFFMICLGISANLWSSYPVGTFDRAVFSNVILLGAVLTLGGASKYWVSLNRFLTAREADNLRINLENNNKELVAVNESLVKLSDELKKHNDQQKLFTAGMNHELRSPLNGIIGLLQVLEDDNTLNNEAKENVDKALSSSVTLINIVNDLLDFYKLEANEYTIVPDPFDLRVVNENVRTSVLSIAEEKNLKLLVEASDDMPCKFKGDGVRIQQIITNLVSNGVKYTEDGFVKISYSFENDALFVKVADSGQGISEEAQNLLFDPFKRFNENKNKYIQGTGLGLSIVKKLVEQMGGEITLYSEIGIGSIFTVKIPLEVLDTSEKFNDELVKENVVSETFDLSGKKFLCVDDNKVNLAVFKGLFKGTNAELKLLLGGAECLEEVKREKYDLIFLDHLMPGMDGIETFEEMKKLDHLNKETPVVMLTANAGAEAEQRYMTKGFDGYLSKPVLRQSLYEVTKKLLNR